MTVATAVLDEVAVTVPFAALTVTGTLPPAVTVTDVGDTVNTGVTVTETVRELMLSAIVTVADPAANPCMVAAPEA